MHLYVGVDMQHKHCDVTQKRDFIMVFHSHKRKVESLQLMINNTEIERVQELNFLGLTVDEHLNWSSHINKISNKVSKNIGILNK